MADAFDAFAHGVDAPAVNSKSVTPSDSVDLPFVSRAISVDADGNLSYQPLGTQGDTTVTRKVVSGIQYAIRAKRIMATGTTATGIVVDW